MEVVVEVDDYYYYEPQIDTNYFEWYAINDSLRIIFEPDEYGFVDSIQLSYTILNDSLYIKQVFSPCEDLYYYYQPEYCLEELADEFGMGELEDLQEMKIENQLIFKSEEYYMDAVSPNVNFPEKFNLYSNFS